MSIADENIAVRRDGNFGRRVKLVESRPGNSLPAERQQDLAILAQLENLMASVVGDPEVSVCVHSQFVGADKHSRPKVFQQLAGGIELKDRANGRVGAATGRTT